ncbi:MAG: homoserine dehydrogenase [Deltaproteobacteria bacterium]|jgi:homoserine dehydrogenase|nr:homoserine dehydrogenase [Deltaproteobacteria bacterium]
MEPTKIGLLGYGHVGAGVAKIVCQDEDLLRHKLGWPIRLVKAVVRNLEGKRGFPPPEGALTTDFAQVVGNPEIEVVCELMGGLEPARRLVLEALAAGQHVVTANKALLAVHGPEIFSKAAEVGREVMFEAAVAGGLPVIKTLKEGLAANRIESVYGILNGTTNYILTRMARDGLAFQTALAEAQQAGYAEADPSSDVDGFDAAYKLSILTALAYGRLPRLQDIHIEGISALEPEDFAFAAEYGRTLKLLTVASLGDDGRLEVRLHPSLLPSGHMLAGVGGALNAVMIRGHASGDIFLSGAGAGMMPTASAVVSDVIEAARVLRASGSHRPPLLGWKGLESADVAAVKPMAEVRTSYYLRLTVKDRLRVLASISGVLGDHNISIAQAIQKGLQGAQEVVSLALWTHTALESDLQAALAELRSMEVVADARVIRVENF